MSTLENFKLLTLKHKPNSSTYRTIFAKEHSIRTIDPEKPSGRTVFLLNVPPYINESELRYAFEKFGEVKSIIFAEKPGKPEETATDANNDDRFLMKPKPFHFKVGYVVFKTTLSVQESLKATELRLYDEETGIGVIKSGLKNWMQEYIDGIVEEKVLQKDIDEYMAVYDQKEQEAKESEKSGEVDEDGWIKVTKRGKNAGFERKEADINKLEEKLEKRKKKKELKNFYSFQIKESKMKNIISLRKKFEEDKEKIECLKKSRRFKPF